MARNFDRFDRLRERLGRLEHSRRFSGLHELRRRLYRSDHGKIMGVFSGIAESLGFCVRWTRIIGALVLLSIASSTGARGLTVTLIVAGFFYLLLALLMQPPRTTGMAGEAPVDDADFSTPHTIPFWKRGEQRPAAVPSYQARRPAANRVDLRQLDQQLDNLDRRIQRMETIVTDRQYDWERRMGS